MERYSTFMNDMDGDTGNYESFDDAFDHGTSHMFSGGDSRTIPDSMKYKSASQMHGTTSFATGGLHRVGYMPRSSARQGYDTSMARHSHKVAGKITPHWRWDPTLRLWVKN